MIHLTLTDRYYSRYPNSRLACNNVHVHWASWCRGMSQDFYQVLGIEKDASQDQVRKAYKRCALETHPDKAAPTLSPEDVNESAITKFRRVHEAFQVLSNPYQRRAYDIRITSKPDGSTKTWKQLDEDQLARMKDREEWALQAAQKRRERITALDEARRVYEETRVKRYAEKGPEYQEMLTKMMEELCEQNPEWELRKDLVRRHKIEREGKSKAAWPQSQPASCCV